MNILRRLTSASCLVLSLALTGAPAAALAEETPEQYGSEAYTYLKYISDNFSSRLNEANARSESVDQTGKWIASQLESYGYKVDTQEYIHEAYTGINYIAEKTGNSSDLIIVGAHYDSVDTAGIDDNASGVSTLLELADRFSTTDTPCTIQFVFFDTEEFGGYVGSYNYVYYYLKEKGQFADTLCYINLDCIGAGDRLYAYGGAYENDTLERSWVYSQAMLTAKDLGISLYTLPEEVTTEKSPAAVSGSDQHYFNVEGIPYLYLEASLWCNDDGTGGNDETSLSRYYQTSDEAFASTGGQIMHTPFDSLDQLNTLLPGRLQSNLSDASELVSTMLSEITPATRQGIEDGLVSYITPSEEETEESETAGTGEVTESSAESTSESTSEAASEKETEEVPEVIYDSNHHYIIGLLVTTSTAAVFIVFFLLFRLIALAGKRRR